MRKIKRLLSALLALATGAAATLGLPACGGESQSSSAHTHTLGEWVRVSSGENCAEGAFKRGCAECDYTEERAATAEDHAWSENYAYNSAKHWRVCASCGEIKDEAWHMNDGQEECRICKNLIPTSCVTYALSADGSYAIVTGYDKTETDSVIVAPTYENVPVKAVGDAAFEGCDNLTSVILPDGITSIGANAFSGCESLMGILIQDSVTSVGDNAFGGCGELTVFCEQEETAQAGWSEGWNPLDRRVIWGYKGERMSAVSLAAMKIADGMLLEPTESRKQILKNPDLGGVKAPEGFSELTRFDATVTVEGTLWTSGVLQAYNYNKLQLTRYSEVWFAVKLVNAYWAFVSDTVNTGEPCWVYFHMTNKGADEDGFTCWDIEASIGGQVYEKIENQTGRQLDLERPTDSISRLLWDEGFNSADKNAILVYPSFKDENYPVTIYCTEVLGLGIGV